MSTFMSRKIADRWRFIHYARCAFWGSFAFGFGLITLAFWSLFHSWMVTGIMAVCTAGLVEAAFNAKRLGGEGE